MRAGAARHARFARSVCPPLTHTTCCRHVSVAYRDANLVGLVDLFGVAVSCLLGDVVEFFQQHNIPFDPRAVYAVRTRRRAALRCASLTAPPLPRTCEGPSTLCTRAALCTSRVRGTLQGASGAFSPSPAARPVAANPERFLVPSPELPLLLREFRRSGNKLFLLTNSEHWFIDAGMRFLAGEQWREVWALRAACSRALTATAAVASGPL